MSLRSAKLVFHITLYLLSFPSTISSILLTNKLNDRPIIALLAQLHPETSTTSYIAASYVKYLEGAGARVVPIPHYFSEDEVRLIFSYVNGVLFPGGGVHWFTSAFYRHAQLLWKLAIQSNDNDDYFPIWGTCLGFETLHVLQANTSNVLSSRIANDVSLPLTYSSDVSDSRLFKGMSEKLFAATGSEKLTYNHHKSGVSPETYDSTPLLNDFFHVLSTSKDVHGKEFVSTVEAFDYPIYGTQWHPEKNVYEFTTLYTAIPHTSNAVQISQYMANFFVGEARKSTHRFPSVEMEEDYLIYKYTPVHSAIIYPSTHLFSHFEQIYLFQSV